MAIVTFSNNAIDATAMVGGYSSWQLIPNGPLIKPANQITPKITMPATSLIANKPDGNFDVYKPGTSVDYDENELVVLTGPSNAAITMEGQQSHKTSIWAFKLTTTASQ